MKMNGTSTFRIELYKGRHRHLLLVPLGFLLVLALWSGFSHRNLDAYDLACGYTRLFYQLPLLNCVLMPIMLSVIASRLCDMEIKGGTLKLLYTLEKKSSFYDLKFLHEFLYTMVFILGEGICIPVFGHMFHFTEPLSFSLLLRHVLCLVLAAFPVLCLQHVLSLMVESQIAPLFFGLAGSFLGLFSCFFSHNISRLILWGYFAAFLPYGLDYDRESRISTFYPVKFPAVTFILFTVFSLAFYAICRRIFLKKEV